MKSAEKRCPRNRVTQSPHRRGGEKMGEVSPLMIPELRVSSLSAAFEQPAMLSISRLLPCKGIVCLSASDSRVSLRHGS